MKVVNKKTGEVLKVEVDHEIATYWYFSLPLSGARPTWIENKHCLKLEDLTAFERAVYGIETED